MQGPAEEHRFPCRQCGADMRFAPGEGKLICDFCGHEEAVSGAGSGRQPIPETALRDGLKAALPDADIEVARYSKCPNCGAEIRFDPAVHAVECPFCATPVVADTGESRRIKPRAVAPFVLTGSEARAAMSAWLGSRWFAPSGFQDYARKGRALSGIYVPYWTFDADTASTYSGRRGTIYHEMQRVHVRDAQGRRKSENRRIAKVRWAPVSGRVARVFDDILVLASQALPKRHTDALEPWDLSRLVPYNPEYLAGFRAEGYTIPLDRGMTEARTIMDRMIERDVRFDIGGDRQEIHSIQTSISGVTFKHIMLPVWSAAYRYRGQSFRFVVNGQTGRVAGERPWSAVKVAAAAILAALVAAAAVYLSRSYGAPG